MRIAVGCDHAGLPLKRELLQELSRLGHEVDDRGTFDERSVDYPDFASAVAQEVGGGKAPLGVLVCGTGIGMSIAANKHRGVRAAVCSSEYEAQMARAHNDANVLCLGSRVVGPGLAASVLRAFLAATFEGGRHAGRVRKIALLEDER